MAKTIDDPPAIAPSGISLRDYFAANAMASLLFSRPIRQYPSAEIALDAYEVADAMLRAKKEGK